MTCEQGGQDVNLGKPESEPAISPAETATTRSSRLSTDLFRPNPGERGWILGGGGVTLVVKLPGGVAGRRSYGKCRITCLQLRRIPNGHTDIRVKRRGRCGRDTTNPAPTRKVAMFPSPANPMLAAIALAAAAVLTSTAQAEEVTIGVPSVAELLADEGDPAFAEARAANPDRYVHVRVRKEDTREVVRRRHTRVSRATFRRLQPGTYVVRYRVELNGKAESRWSGVTRFRVRNN